MKSYSQFNLNAAAPPAIAYDSSVVNPNGSPLDPLQQQQHQQQQQQQQRQDMPHFGLPGPQPPPPTSQQQQLQVHHQQQQQQQQQHQQQQQMQMSLLPGPYRPHIEEKKLTRDAMEKYMRERNDMVIVILHAKVRKGNPLGYTILGLSKLRINQGWIV